MASPPRHLRTSGSYKKKTAAHHSRMDPYYPPVDQGYENLARQSGVVLGRGSYPNSSGSWQEKGFREFYAPPASDADLYQHGGRREEYGVYPPPASTAYPHNGEDNEEYGPYASDEEGEEEYGEGVMPHEYSHNNHQGTNYYGTNHAVSARPHKPSSPVRSHGASQGATRYGYLTVPAKKSKTAKTSPGTYAHHPRTYNNGPRLTMASLNAHGDPSDDDDDDENDPYDYTPAHVPHNGNGWAGNGWADNGPKNYDWSTSSKSRSPTNAATKRKNNAGWAAASKRRRSSNGWDDNNHPIGYVTRRANSFNNNYR